MNTPVFHLPPLPQVPIAGEDATFPVRRIFCVGRNYAAHAAEMGVEVDREAPFYFTKSAANAVLSEAKVPYPPGTQNFHYEMELAVAIKESLFRAKVDEVESAIFGYGCALDMTRRDLQISERKKQRPWDLGKDLENGTVLAPLTRVPDWSGPKAERIWLSVNGQIKQEATLTDMIWSVPEILSHLSGYYHLAPGDVILTGTPAGVGPVVAGDHIVGGIDNLASVSLFLSPGE